jgi:hypothetical protein
MSWSSFIQLKIGIDPEELALRQRRNCWLVLDVSVPTRTRSLKQEGLPREVAGCLATHQTQVSDEQKIKLDTICLLFQEQTHIPGGMTLQQKSETTPREKQLPNIQEGFLLLEM